MKFTEWEPVYERILAAFGYGRAADERARDRLESICERPIFDPAKLDFTGDTVAVVGGAETVTAQLDQANAADTVVAASIAADRLQSAGISVDLMVTDLDKTPETAKRLAEAGTPVAVHAHGDNVPAIESVVPSIDSAWLLPTTQAKPTANVHNLGGFTDGDRAAFLADSAGAKGLVFPGWDFDDESVGVEKRQKLVWAERLLYWLEHRRDEQFSILDDRRDGIDTTALPVE